MAAQGLASQVGVAPACRALGVSRATFYRRHDTFIEHCVRTVRESLPRAKIEVRIDSAFFNQGIVGRLHSLGVTFTVSVPFERFAELKEMVERRQRWRPMAGGLEYFERSRPFAVPSFNAPGASFAPPAS